MENNLSAEESTKQYTCTNCGVNVEQTYCPNCGQRKLEKDDLSIKSFLEDALEVLIHFDNKFFRSLKYLIIKPGFLSDEYVHGRRVSYMKPLQLFLVLNIVLFFLLRSTPFSQDLYSYEHYTNNRIHGMIERKREQLKDQFNVFETKFNERVTEESKLYIIIFIPANAILFFLLFFYKKRYFTEHLVLAAHYFSFSIILIILAGLIETVYYRFISPQTVYSLLLDGIVSYSLEGLLFFYLLAAFRRFYKSGWIWTLVASGVVSFLFIILLDFYRVQLFYLLYWMR